MNFLIYDSKHKIIITISDRKLHITVIEHQKTKYL